MLENIVIRRAHSGTDPALDVGLLAEALLFYQSAHLLLVEGSLAHLLKAVGPDNLLYLLKSGHLKATFVRDVPVTVTTSDHGISTHVFRTVELVGHKQQRFRKEDIVLRDFEKALGQSWATKRAAKKFLEKVPFTRIGDGAPERLSLNSLAEGDLTDHEYVQRAVEILIRDLAPDFAQPGPWEFRPIVTDTGFVIITNIDFQRLNEVYHRSVPPSHSSVSPAFLLNHLFDARCDIWLGARYMAELVTTPVLSQLVQVKFDGLPNKRGKNAEQLAVFQQATLGNAHALREAINNGTVTFDEFLRVLDGAAKFKHWLAGINPDFALVQEYYSACTKGTWLERLPGKIMRFVTLTGGGVLLDIAVPSGLGTLGGLGLSLADTFLLNRLYGGWRPNQFVQGKLKPLLKP